MASSSSSSSSSSSAPIAWRAGSDRARVAGQRHFNAFLRESRARLSALLPASDAPQDVPSAGSSPPVVHVVLGNEAADADSIVSALVYAFAKRHHRHPRVHSAVDAHDSSSSCCYVPVLPIPRSELALRCDVVALFRALEVDVGALMFVDEFPWAHARLQRRQVRLRATLVDHNALTNKRVGPVDDAAVVEIVDHHMDLRAHATADPRDVAFADGQALVASTCTLVAERLAAVLDDADASDATDADVQELHALPATMLLGVMALDSVAFDPAAKKVTPRDVAAAERLETLALADRSALFAWLQAEKFDPSHWARFSLANCLQCDYKEFAFPGPGDERKYGVSSVLIALDAFVNKAAGARELEDELNRYCEDNELQFLVAMTIFVTDEGERRRQLLFFQPGRDGELVHRCVAFFQEERSLRIEPLELPPTHKSERILAFRQLNTGASRKQVVPLLQRALARL